MENAISLPPALEARQKATLDIGCALVVSALAAGIEIGGWPLWSALLAAAGYAAWVIVYSEVTVQVELRRRAGRPSAV